MSGISPVPARRRTFENWAALGALGEAGYVIHASGGVAIGSLMIAATLSAFRATLIPASACWLGVISGILAIFSTFSSADPGRARPLVAGVLLFRASPAPIAS